MQDNRDQSGNKRQNFRIEYPISYRPKLIISYYIFEVLDISEQGIKFFPKRAYELKLGLTLSAKIVFKGGESFNIKGKIIRNTGKEVILSLLEGIPTSKIMSEQRVLINKYPGRPKP